MKPKMYHPLAGAIVLISMSLAIESRAAVIYTDNFDVANTNNFNTSSQTGRHTGLHAGDVLPQSGGIQLTISGGQLNLLTPAAGTATGRMRLENSASPGSLWNFASGAGGSAILADGGMTISFDWTAANNTAGDWISYSVGFTAFDQDFRVVNSATDGGIFIRNNGNASLFDNSAADGSGTIDVTNLTRHIQLDYFFNSFADGSLVSMNASSDGLLFASQSFDWNGNSGALFMELGSVGAGNRIDNFSITTVPEPSAFVLLGLGGLASSWRRRKF